jgi:hypothetical protein
VIFTHFGDLGRVALSLFIGFSAFWPIGIVIASLGLSMTDNYIPESIPLLNATRSRVISTGSTKSHFDSAISLIEVIGETETALYWQGERQRVLSAFGSVRTKSAEGEATKNGVDFGSASLAKVLKHLSTPKREGALLAAAWAMSSAIALK